MKWARQKSREILCLQKLLQINDLHRIYGVYKCLGKEGRTRWMGEQMVYAGIIEWEGGGGEEP